MIRRFRWAALIVFGGLLVFAWSYRFWLAALGGFLVKEDGPARADMIVVLGGDRWGDRVLKAGELVREGYAPRVLVSGAECCYGMHESDLAIPFAVRHGYPESYFIAFPNDALSTREEAQILLTELRKRNVHSIDLVTSNYHTRRAAAVYRAQDPALAIHVVAASDRYFTPDAWWKTREGEKEFAVSWAKTLASWLGI